MRIWLRAFWRIIKLPFRFLRWLALTIARGFRTGVRDIYEFFTFEEEDTPLGDAVATAVANPMGLMDHLVALRRHIMRAAFVMLITTIISFTFAKQTLDFLASPAPGGLAAMRAIEPTENVGTYMWVALLLGFAMAFPYIVLELWMFVAPGLSRKTRIWGLAAIPIALFFLLSGMAFVYFLMLKVALKFLLGFMGMKTQLRPSSYFRFVTSLMFWIGLFFEFPLVVFILAKIGLVRAGTLLKQWRLAVVIIAIVAAVITPTVDPVNMSVVMAPMIILYFLGIGLAYLARRDKNPKEVTLGDQLRQKYLG